MNCGNNGAPAAPEYCTTYCTTTPELCPSDIFGGIKLRCSDCLVTGNQIISSKSPLTPTGIYIWGGNRNLVADNFMKGVGHFGIDAVGSQIFGLNHIDLTTAQKTANCQDYPRFYRGCRHSNYKPPESAGPYRQGSITFDPNPPFRRAGGMGLRGPGEQRLLHLGRVRYDRALDARPHDRAHTVGAQTITGKDLTDSSNTFPPSLVTLTGPQTLTNKNLSDPSNTLPAVPIDLTILNHDGVELEGPLGGHRAVRHDRASGRRPI